MNFLKKEIDTFTKKTWRLICSIFHRSKSLNDLLVRAVNVSVFFAFFLAFHKGTPLGGFKKLKFLKQKSSFLQIEFGGRIFRFSNQPTHCLICLYFG